MHASERFDRYLEHLSAGLGHADRHAGLRGYCTGLMLPLSRKSVEPMAARVDPMHASARHQALHHFVAKAEWSHTEMLRRVAQWVIPKMDFRSGGWWIIDDTGFPKKGRHSVGVTRQYCGMLGKQDNCQVAVSLSLASDQGSLPVAWQLYLPEDWAADAARRTKAGVPEEVRFATKTQIALEQLRALLDEGAPRYCVLADAGYGVDTAFRQALSDMGLPYAVGVTSAVVVWPPGVQPLPPKPYSGVGRPPVVPQRTAALQPLSVKALAMSLPPQAFRNITWREGSNAALSGRFAAVRVRHAGGNAGKARLRPEQWLLIEWPACDEEPSKYVLSTLPEGTPLDELVRVAHHRWRIERDYQDLKQDFGLGHYEGRGWRGFHHHAALSIAAYGFLMAERLIADKPVGGKKNFVERQVPALPEDYVPRGSSARAAPRDDLDHELAPSAELPPDRSSKAVPLLRKSKRKASLMTQ
ncbi:MAG: IS701 family transposase [Phenylobacterium sp.]|uniref:IS701 family transposase n=1 Tax=Phenylobacterium sp. TaxID=1871053 RepID=UPI00120C1BD4|nr:IS701 family transposase [Phenylobacterium sp.]TAL28252.1 MAG: IS701 family transposase [Phenylobacterium sp.]